MSLRLRLSVSLLAALALAALVLGGATYRNTLHEVAELFDYQLRQMALSLRDQGEIAAGPPAAELDFVVQIWSDDGRAIYASRAHAALPSRAVLGFADVDVQGQPWRTYSVATPSRVIQVAQPRQIRERLAADAAWRSVLPLLWLAPLLAAAVWWLVAHALAPLQRLSREVLARDARSFAPLPVAGLPEEVAPLARALNGLLQRLSAAFGAQRAFVADAAHELRSPLTALKLQVELLARAGTTGPARDDAVAALGAGIDRATRLVEQLLTLARNEPGAGAVVPVALDLGELVRDALIDGATFALARGSTLTLDAEPGVRVRGEAAGLTALARNLADNALRHSPPGARVAVAVGADQGGAWLRVDDSGPGIAESEREQAFARFWRRETPAPEAAPSGSGLGLAIVKGVAERHGATLRLATSPLGGLRVEVRFPRAG